MADGYEPVCTVWACFDCALAHANGEVSDDLPEGCVPLSEVREDEQVTMGVLNHFSGCIGDDCKCDRIDFTWSPCELCTCRLGGERQGMTLWRKRAAAQV